MSDRDARVDPKPGDVLRDGLVQRKVTQEPRANTPCPCEDLRKELVRRDAQKLLLLVMQQQAEAERDSLRAELAKEEAAHANTIDQRDAAEDAADELAYSIAPVEEIGEHSNLNDPWKNAVDKLEEMQADLQAVRADLAASQERERGLREALEDCKAQMEAFADQMAGYPNYGRAIDAAVAALATPEGKQNE